MDEVLLFIAQLPGSEDIPNALMQVQVLTLVGEEWSVRDYLNVKPIECLEQSHGERWRASSSSIEV